MKASMKRPRALTDGVTIKATTLYVGLNVPRADVVEFSTAGTFTLDEPEAKRLYRFLSDWFNEGGD